MLRALSTLICALFIGAQTLFAQDIKIEGGVMTPAQDVPGGTKKFLMGEFLFINQSTEASRSVSDIVFKRTGMSSNSCLERVHIGSSPDPASIFTEGTMDQRGDVYISVNRSIEPSATSKYYAFIDVPYGNLTGLTLGLRLDAITESSAGLPILTNEMNLVTQYAICACNDGIDNDGDGLIDMTDPGCTSQTDSNEYNSTSSGVADVPHDNVGLYPNPVSVTSAITIHVLKETDVRILTVTGKEIFSEKVNAGNTQLTFPSRGIYLVSMDQRVQKVIVQ